MTERQREVALGLAVIVFLVAGIGFDSVRGHVEPQESQPPGDLFVERARFCPPPVGKAVDSGIALASPPGSTGEVRASGEEIKVSGDHAVVVRTSGSSTPVGAGTFVTASAFQRSDTSTVGAGAARCSAVASPQWFFAEGSSALDFAEKIIVYNPFPYEAVVRVTLFTPGGEEARANLDEQPVPAGETTVIDLNEFIRQQRFVGVSINALRGRVVAWKSLDVRSDDRSPGMTLTLGATQTSDTWFFPEGEVSAGADERITLLNPTDEEAIVNVSISTSSETVQPPKLVEVLVPPRSLLPLPLHEYVTGARRDLGGASVSVRATSGAGIVAERTVFYDSARLTGVAGEVGASDSATAWMVGPPAGAPETDALVVMNPGAETATVSVVILPGKGAPIEPKRFTNLKIKGGTRRKLPIGTFTRGRTAIVVVTSDQPIVAERVGMAGGDVASVMGTKFTK
jgi:hypothetical protein